MPDKILVTNKSALKDKYSREGLRAVLDAVSVLIAADKAKGLSTEFVDISDAVRMRRYQGRAVSSAKNGRQCKDAVDAIYAAEKPSYLAILDAPDVVPHLILKNPTPKDGDGDVPSDLPYASDESFTRRDAAKFAAVTRVVGRIPGIMGAAKPDYLIKQLHTAARFRSRGQASYLANFAISAAPWKKSTLLSVDNIFGSKVVRLCPPTESPGVRRMLSPLSHFINCHGGPLAAEFYGQRGKSYPVSMRSKDVATGVRRGTIVAAECCFGAQLFDPGSADGDPPVSNAYLGAGAIGFLGSTTTAYGPAEGNSGADLITQYFLIYALAGASLGRACLQARQKFVLGQKMEDPVNLKTLAQFLLLGDPSLQPCLIETPDAKAAAHIIDHSAARTIRRVALVSAGKAAADSSGFPGERIVRPPKRLHRLVRKIARERGFRASSKNLESFHIVGGSSYGKEMKTRGMTQKVVMVTEHRPAPGKKTRGGKVLAQTRILVTHTHDDRIIGVSEYVRK